MNDPRLERFKTARTVVAYLNSEGALILHDAYVTAHGTVCYGYGNTWIDRPVVGSQNLPYGDTHPMYAQLKIPADKDLAEPGELPRCRCTMKPLTDRWSFDEPKRKRRRKAKRKVSARKAKAAKGKKRKGAR